MEAKHPHSSAPLPEGPKQQDFFQEPSNSHQPPSESSQTYTGAPSDTGDGASGRSMTATTANFDPITDQAVLDQQLVITFLLILSFLSFLYLFPLLSYSPIKCSAKRSIPQRHLKFPH